MRLWCVSSEKKVSCLTCLKKCGKLSVLFKFNGEKDMCKFVVIQSRNWSVGTNGILYEIYDTVTFDPKKDLENQMRKYSYRYFYNKGRNPWKLRKEVFCRRRHILKGDGSIFAERIKIFENESNNELLGFIPMECFVW